MRSGTVYGTAAMIDGLVKRFEKELGQEATVIITGGLGGVIAKNCETKAIIAAVPKTVPLLIQSIVFVQIAFLGATMSI